MNINSINNQSFGKISLSSNALIKMNDEQVALFRYAQEKIMTNPNKIHFDIGKDNQLIIAVLDMNNKIKQIFNGSSQKILDDAITYCKKLSKIPEDYGNHPISFEKFLDSLFV